MVEAALGRLLVALDDSSAADRALAFALELCSDYGSELVLGTVLNHERELAMNALPDAVVPSAVAAMANYDRAATALLHEASARALAAGARSSTVVLEGRAPAAIVACANERGADAVVMGTRGKTAVARTFVGSTANGVLRLADTPVFVVPDPVDERSSSLKIERMLVALDDSEASAAALRFALALGSPQKTVLICCSVVDTGQLVDNAEIYGCDPEPFIEEVRDAARTLVAERTAGAEKGVRAIERIVLEGPAADVILRAAVERRADLIVCGTHGRGGLQRLFLGSVAEVVVRRSTVPVAVVRR